MHEKILIHEFVQFIICPATLSHLEMNTVNFKKAKHQSLQGILQILYC